MADGIDLARAYVQIVPTTKNIKQELTSAMSGDTEAAAETCGKTFGEKFKGALGTTLKAGAAGIATLAAEAVGAGAALVGAASSAAQYGDNIDKMSQKMNLSAEAYQEWDFVMQHCGTSIELMQASIKTLSNAAENGSEAFETLGISQEQLANLSGEELFGTVIEKLQDVDNETQRTYLAGQLLGRGATELGPLLNTSAEETAAMKQQVHELGGVLSNEAVKNAAAFQDSLQNMQTAMGGLKTQMAAEFLPGFTQVMDGVTALFTGDEGGIAKIGDGFSQISEKITELLPIFGEIALQIITSIGETIVTNLPTLLESALEIVQTLNQTILDNLPLFIDVAMQVILTLINGLAEFLPQLLAQAPVIITAVVNGLLQNMPALITAAVQLIGALVKGLIQALPQIISAGWELIKSLISGIGQTFSQLWSLGKDLVQQIWQGLMGKINDAANWGKDLIQNFIGGLKQKWENLKSTVSNIASGIKSFLGFSEPEKGPLSDFHTYAPDMMKLFAKGIKDNEYRITDQLNTSFDLQPAIMGFGAPAGVATTGGSVGAINVNVYASDGMDVRELAKKVSEEISFALDRRTTAWA